MNNILIIVNTSHNTSLLSVSQCIAKTTLFKEEIMIKMKSAILNRMPDIKKEQSVIVIDI